MARPDTTQLKSLLDPARYIAILLPQSPRYDVVASGLALKLALEPAGKSVSIACADPMTVEFTHLVGVDTITSSFGNRNLVITFPNQTEHVDKVSYNLDHGELQLVITPKANAPDLDHRRLKFLPGSSHADLLILVGVGQLLDLGPLYQDSKDTLATAKLLSLTHDFPKENYTPHQLYDPEAAALSELVAHLIDALGLNFHQDVATNLLAGLEKATDFFRSPTVTHTTFEVASHLLQRGAQRHSPLSPDGFPTSSIPSQPYTQPTTNIGTKSGAQQPTTNLGYGTDSQPPVAEGNPPPQDDWYAPKIYHGPMLP